MKPITAEEAKSPLFKRALKDLTFERQTSAVDHLRHIEEDKKALPPRQNRITEIDAELEQVMTNLQKFKAEFLDMTDAKQRKAVVQIIELERKREDLQKEQKKVQAEISHLETAIENHKKALDDLRGQEYRFRQEQVTKEKQKLSDAITRDKQRGFITKHYIPLKQKLLQEITAANFAEIKALVDRYRGKPGRNRWIQDFGREDWVLHRYPLQLLKQAMKRLTAFNQEQQLFKKD